MANAIIFQRTGSGVGKRIMPVEFCRLLANLGVSIAPFKVQNDTLNSGITTDRFEMGRAQILSAEAARIPAKVRIIAFLIKPQGTLLTQYQRGL